MSKSLSHESIFMLESEPESPQRKIYPSPELQSGRSLEVILNLNISAYLDYYSSISYSYPTKKKEGGIWPYFFADSTPTGLL